MTKRLPWFRLYTRMVDDDKLKLLAFEDRWHFVALLCLKGEGLLDKDDAPALLMRKIAVKLGLDVRSLEEVARRLAEVGLVDQATLQPVKWAVLQMQSDVDTTASDRKKRQREREKALKASRGNDVTDDHMQVTNGSRVTGTEVTRTDTDTDTDTDTEDEEANASLSASGLPDCPHGEIIELFAKQLPMLPQPKAELWDGQRARALRARWAWVLTAKKTKGEHAGQPYATDRASALEWFSRYFAYVAEKCPHLTGGNDRAWTADMAWLVTSGNFTKVLQGNYHREAA